MRKIISLICLLLPALACADQLQVRQDSRPEIRKDAPDRYTVVKGDTLWDISGKFFNDPWKWPHIWGLNKDTIKDPHWIYPGDEINLDRTTATLRIGNVDTGKPAAISPTIPPKPHAAVPQDAGDKGNVIRLSPKVHENLSGHDAIPSIPANIIEPFLSQPLVIEEDALEGAPVIIGARENRVLLGTNDIGFARGLTPDKGNKWQIYRPGKKLIDPETDEVLGIEAVYLGDAEVKAFADVSTILITKTFI